MRETTVQTIRKFFRERATAGRVTVISWCISVIALLCPSFSENGDGPAFPDPFWGPSADAFHFPLFAWLAATLALVGAGRPNLRILRSLVITSVYAALIEVIQPYVGRSQSMQDFVNGALGAGFACIGVWLYSHGRLASFEDRLRVSALGLATFFTISLPAANGLVLKAYSWVLYPALATFESERDLKLWHAYPSDDENAHGHLEAVVRPGFGTGRALRIVTVPGQWSGVEYAPTIRNWADKAELVLDLASDVPTQVSIRLDDEGPSADYTERINYLVEAEPSGSRVVLNFKGLKTLPSGREFDFSRVKRLLIFVAPQARPVTLYLDSIELH